MNAVLDRLFDFLKGCIDAFRVGIVLDCFESGVILRFGRLRKVLTEPGFYWLAPFYIDRAITDTSVTAARYLAQQTVTLKDDVQIAVQPIVSFKTNDPEVFFLEVDDAEAALRDFAPGTILEVLSAMTWPEVTATDGSVQEALTKAVRKGAWKFGIEVTRVSLADLCRVRTYRLITGN